MENILDVHHKPIESMFGSQISDDDKLYIIFQMCTQGIFDFFGL